SLIPTAIRSEKNPTRLKCFFTSLGSTLCRVKSTCLGCMEERKEGSLFLLRGMIYFSLLVPIHMQYSHPSSLHPS
ncbi:hypothetical protein PENTCL1PPCAC_26122, partial [Pristionchus entomophagus]